MSRRMIQVSDDSCTIERRRFVFQLQRVVISTECVRELRKRRGDWVLHRETPCAEWAEARIESFYGAPEVSPSHSLGLVHVSGKRRRRIMLAQVVGGMNVPPEFEKARSKINELLRRHRNGPPGNPRTRKSGR